jgi:hypothetical protein
MSVSRREILGGAALLGAAGAFGIHKVAGRAKTPQLVIYDSRKPASLAFARSQSGIRQIDLASEQQSNWGAVRALKRQGPIAGLTSWNDYVSARQWLEERGLRLTVETHDRQHDLIGWTMA